MLSFETWDTGFLLTVEGKRLLRHSTRNPCVWVRGPLRWKDQPARTSAALPVPGRRPGDIPADWVPLRHFRLENRGPDRTVIHFEQRLVCDFTYTERVLRMRFEYPEGSAPGLRLRFGATPRERVYGGGPRMDAIDLKGRKRGFRDGEPSIPAFITDEGLWLEVFSTGTGTVRFANDAWTVESQGRPYSLSLGFARGMAEALERMTREPGPRICPPSWPYGGLILDIADRDADAASAVRRAEEAGVRISAVLAAIDQATPEPHRTLTAISPRLEPEGGICRELAADGLLLQDAEGHPARFGDSDAQFCLPDLRSPHARASIAQRLAVMLHGRRSGGWAVDGCVPPEFGSTRSALPQRNPPPALNHVLLDAGVMNALWMDLLIDAARIAGLDDPLLIGSGGIPFGHAKGLARPVSVSDLSGRGSRGLQPTGAGLFSRAGAVPFPAQAVRPMQSLALSGAGFAYMDTGRFPASPDRLEAWLRHLETAAFGPILRVAAPRMDSPMATPELWNRIAKVAEHHALLESYHRECARTWVAEGLPPLRHPMMQYPAEPAQAQEGIYLYGPDLLVAPAMRVRARSRSLDLPRDRWVHLWTSRCYGGGPVTVDAPPGRPAVFYRLESPFAAQFEALRRQAVRA